MFLRRKFVKIVADFNYGHNGKNRWSILAFSRTDSKTLQKLFSCVYIRNLSAVFVNWNLRSRPCLLILEHNLREKNETRQLDFYEI